MRQLMRWLRRMQFARAVSRMLAIGLMTVGLLLAPAFALPNTILQNTVQAQAASDAPDAPEKRLRVIQAQPNEVDTISPEVLKRLQRKAGDLGDKAKQSIKDTGSKASRKLSEKASQAVDQGKKQRSRRGS